MAESDRSKTLFTNGLYDKLKFIALILLPAFATLYLTLDSIWSLKYTTQIVGTVTAIDTFLGALLRFSTSRYYKSEANFDGDVNVLHKPDGENRVSFAFNEPPEVIVDEPGKHSMEFKINHVTETG